MTADIIQDWVTDLIIDLIGIGGATFVGKFLIFDTGEFIEFDDGSIMEIT